MFLHFGVEAGFVYFQALFGADELREVEGEAVGVEEGECLFAVHGVAACLDGLLNHAFEQRDACREGAEEGLFFFFHHAPDERLLRR